VLPRNTGALVADRLMEEGIMSRVSHRRQHRSSNISWEDEMLEHVVRQAVQEETQHRTGLVPTVRILSHEESRQMALSALAMSRRGSMVR
jgi:hypothetical protein